MSCTKCLYYLDGGIGLEAFVLLFISAITAILVTALILGITKIISKIKITKKFTLILMFCAYLCSLICVAYVYEHTQSGKKKRCQEIVDDCMSR